MNRVDKIINNECYRQCYNVIQQLEEERIFCGHDMIHFLDVARIAYILNLESGLKIDKEIIYATALLHDIGRHMQYIRNIPHHEASAQIAEGILKDSGFSQKETENIILAILAHRDKTGPGREDLSGIICRADKISRNCFDCNAQMECNWPSDKKNMLLEY